MGKEIKVKGNAPDEAKKLKIVEKKVDNKVEKKEGKKAERVNNNDSGKVVKAGNAVTDSGKSDQSAKKGPDNSNGKPAVAASATPSSGNAAPPKVQSERRKLLNKKKYEGKLERRKKAAKEAAKLAAAAASGEVGGEAEKSGDNKNKDSKDDSKSKRDKTPKPKKDVHLDSEAGASKKRVVTTEPEGYHCFRCNIDFIKRFSYLWETSEGDKTICNGCYGLLHKLANPKPPKEEIDGESSDSEGNEDSNLSDNVKEDKKGDKPKVRPSIAEEARREKEKARLAAKFILGIKDKSKDKPLNSSSGSKSKSNEKVDEPRVKEDKNEKVGGKRERDNSATLSEGNNNEKGQKKPNKKSI